MHIQQNTHVKAMLGALGLLLLGACGAGDDTAKVAPPPPKVVVAEVLKETVPIVMEFSGTVQGIKQVAIKPRVSGYLQKRLFIEGGEVKAGDPLYQIDPRPFQAQLDATQAQLAVDQASLEFAESEVKRYTSLAKQGAGSVEKKEDMIKEQKKATAGIAKDQADIEEAKLNLGYTRINAPFDGVIEATRVYQGAVVTAQQTVMTHLVALDTVYVLFNISRRDVFTVQQLQQQGLSPTVMNEHTATVRLPDGSSFSEQGHMDYVSSQLDPQTDTFSARALFDNPKKDRDSRLLIPGQYVPLSVTVGKRPDTLLIPQTALLQTQEGTYVYVVGEGNKVAKRMVEKGPAYKHYWEIYKGLKEGEKVISVGVSKVRGSGMVVDPSPAAAADAKPAAAPAA